MNRAFNYARLLTAPGTQIVSPTITVKLKGTGTNATIFADDLHPTPTPKANPFVADQYGYWFFYAADGRYDVLVSGGTPAVLNYTLGDVGVFSGAYLSVNAADYGVVGDNVVDDTVALQAAFNAGAGVVRTVVKIPNGFTCKVTAGIVLPSYLVIDGYGARIDATSIAAGPGYIETLKILGSNASGSEGHDITVLGLTLQNNPRSAQVHGTGYGFTFPPYNLTFRDVVTLCPVTDILNGLEFTTCKHVVIDRHYNKNGVSAVNAGSDEYATRPTTDITITNSWTEATVGFGYQFAAAQGVKVIGCYIDGTLITYSGAPEWDYTGITVDRCENILLQGNVIKNPKVAGIFVTGSQHVVVANNQIDGGGLTLIGIYIAYNAELLPATLAIHESYYVTVVGNEIADMIAAGNGILFNGVRYSAMMGNVVGSPMGAGSEDLVIQDGVRGATPMLSKFNTVAGNVCGGSGTLHISSAAVGSEQMCVSGNIVGTLLGNARMCVLNGIGGGIDFSNGVTLYRDSGTGYLTIGGGAVFGDLGVAGTFAHTGANLGFFGHAAVNRQTLTVGVSTLADVINFLKNLGLSG